MCFDRPLSCSSSTLALFNRSISPLHYFLTVYFNTLLSILALLDRPETFGPSTFTISLIQTVHFHNMLDSDRSLSVEKPSTLTQKTVHYRSGLFILIQMTVQFGFNSTNFGRIVHIYIFKPSIFDLTCIREHFKDALLKFTLH